MSRPSVPAYLSAYNLEFNRMRLLGHNEAFAAIAAFRAGVKHLTVGNNTAQAHDEVKSW